MGTVVDGSAAPDQSCSDWSYQPNCLIAESQRRSFWPKHRIARCSPCRCPAIWGHSDNLVNERLKGSLQPRPQQVRLKWDRGYLMPPGWASAPPAGPPAASPAVLTRSGRRALAPRMRSAQQNAGGEFTRSGIQARQRPHPCAGTDLRGTAGKAGLTTL